MGRRNGSAHRRRPSPFRRKRPSLPHPAPSATRLGVRFLLGSVLFLGACSPQGSVSVKLEPQTLPGAKVATYQGGAVSEADLNKRFAEMNPYVRARYQTVDQRKEFTESLLRFELLVREAVKRGVQNDPEIVEGFKKAMVRKLLQQELEEKRPTIPAEEIAAYYAKHESDYVKPAMVRLSHVLTKKPNRAQAEENLKRALAMEPLDYAAYATLAREKSEDPKTQPIEGDLRFQSDAELTAAYGPELAAAAAELTRVGEVLPRLVETQDAFHVIKLQGRQVALNLELAQVKTSIENILVNEKRVERYKTMLATLFSDANVKIDEAALGRIVVDPKAPASLDGGTMPSLPPPPEALSPPRDEHGGH